MNPSILIQLQEYINLAFVVIKPATLIYVVLFLCIARPVQTGTLREQSLGIIYYVLEAISFVLISVGAIPPLVAFLNQETLNPEWYIAFLCTFACGGLLYIWTDNALRALPAPSIIVPRILFIGCVRMIGILATAFSLITIGFIALNRDTNHTVWWIMPLISILYGGILIWLTTDSNAMLNAAHNNAKIMPVSKTNAPVKNIVAKQNVATMPKKITINSTVKKRTQKVVVPVTKSINVKKKSRK